MAKRQVTPTTNIDNIMQFFLHVFCPHFQNLLYDRRNTGITPEEHEALANFIMNARHRSAALGDVWWHNIPRFERTIESRVGKIFRLFEKWHALKNNDTISERKRLRMADRITKQIARLGRTYRNNVYLIEKDLDLKQLEADINFFVGQRSLGLAPLKEAISSALGEIFANMRREPR